uniref:Uncharacterized protein n=1 Tax=Avena sativa TaxID=4498 RepID=A0ACD5U397_AVESA
MARLMSTVLPALVACLLVFVFSATPTLSMVSNGRATARQQSTSLDDDGAARTYVVLVEPPAHAHAHDEAAHRRWHESFLRPGGSRSTGGRDTPTIRHSYTGVFSGFAATLTEDELAAVSRKRGFVRAFPERKVPLMTTRTPGFLGLDPKRGVWKATKYGEGVVIGMLDTGVAASHPSFGDEGMSPPPARWKGTCQPPAKCNNKIVGLVSVMGGNDTTDNIGHGTHTAATAEFDGESLTQDKRFSAKEYPLYYPQGSNYCDVFDVNITGKVVVCDTQTPLPPLTSIEAVQKAGGAGVVFINEADFGYTIVVEKYYNLPMSQVTATDGSKIMGYAREGPPSSAAPLNATILFNSSMVHVKPAPVVAAFSSRGPNAASPGVLKPDILAPGLNILAAWPSMVPVDGDEASYDYNVASGTSMATPHVSGIVALIKKAHPDWSPSAIKSAIMTTSSAVDNAGNPIMDEAHQKASAYSIGAGHVDGAKAVDPGLVYDLGVGEYSAYICALLGEAAMKTITGNNTLSCATVGSIPEAQLNYPTILVPLSDNKFKVKRTVTNVGPAKSRYTAHVHAPKWLKVKVEPEELEFKEAMEKKTFTVTVSREGDDGGQIAEGSLHWVSKDHVVRSPIVADSRVVKR